MRENVIESAYLPGHLFHDWKRWYRYHCGIETNQASEYLEVSWSFALYYLIVVGCALIGLLPSDVNAKVCMYSYKCKGTSRNLIHTQTSTVLRTDGRTNKPKTNETPRVSSYSGWCHPHEPYREGSNLRIQAGRVWGTKSVSFSTINRFIYIILNFQWFDVLMSSI